MPSPQPRASQRREAGVFTRVHRAPDTRASLSVHSTRPPVEMTVDLTTLPTPGTGDPGKEGSPAPRGRDELQVLGGGHPSQEAEMVPEEDNSVIPCLAT